ncbi:MAG: biotin--[Prevotella sp.]|nr:biotin--[acetyl-CoA-carboxylase] ligase [Prevotella sp.]
MEFKVIHIDETDSTNGWLREFASDEHRITRKNDIRDVQKDIRDILCHSDANIVIVAEYQSAGKGCGSNTWESEKGKNLTFSVLLHPTEIRAKWQFRISEAVSVALCETLERLFRPFSPSDSSPDSGEQKVTIKWPNDIYVGDRKICGILIENRLKGSTITDSIVGIGLNVNQREFLSDAPNPVSIYQLTGEETDREALLQAFLAELSKAMEMEPEALTEAYHRRLYRRVGMHLFSDSQGDFEAKVLNVLDDGRLVLLDAEGKARMYAFKEVAFCL